MRKAKSLVGLNIITQSEGLNLGTVRDLIFSDQTHSLVALLLTDRELFGMIDATCIPWDQVREVGPNALMVPSEDAISKIHANPIIAEAFDARVTLDGKQVTTEGGENLGSISDIYLDDAGQIVGYEISGGVFADAFNGKRYLQLPSTVTIGQDVVIVPQDVVVELQRQKTQEPGGVRGAVASASTTLSDTYDTTKAKVSSTYDSIASASVDKQREFVIGKTAGRDVILPAAHATLVSPEALTVEAVEAGDLSPSDASVTSELHRDTPAMATDINSSGEVVEGEILVRKGEVITAEQANRAVTAGVLGQLVAAATLGAAAGAGPVGATDGAGPIGATDGAGPVGTPTPSAYSNSQDSLALKAIGQPAGREVTAPDGSVIVAPGMIITQAIIERADSYGKRNEVIASAGLGAASQSAQQAYGQVRETATSLFGSVKEKIAELTGSAQEKKADYDAAALDKKIKNALGRPVTRVILAQDDSVILNTGDLVTNRAIQRAREEDALDILLDSIYEASPAITPEMLRVQQSGDAALASQIQPETQPVTSAIVTTDSNEAQPQTQNQPQP